MFCQPGAFFSHPCWFDGVFDHEFTLQSDTIGDYSVIGGTQTYHWLECENCGAEKEATHADLSDPLEEYYWGNES